MFNTHVHNGHLTYFQQRWNLIKLATSRKCLFTLKRTEEHNARINVSDFVLLMTVHHMLLYMRALATSQFLSLKDLKQNKGSNFVKLTQDASQDIILKSYDCCALDDRWLLLLDHRNKCTQIKFHF